MELEPALDQLDAIEVTPEQWAEFRKSPMFRFIYNAICNLEQQVAELTHGKAVVSAALLDFQADGHPPITLGDNCLTHWEGVVQRYLAKQKVQH